MIKMIGAGAQRIIYCVQLRYTNVTDFFLREAEVWFLQNVHSNFCCTWCVLNIAQKRQYLTNGFFEVWVKAKLKIVVVMN